MNGVFGTSGPTAMWYLARGSGVVTLVLLTASVVLGIVTSVRWSSRRWPRFVIEFLHRNVALLVVTFLGIHVATVVVDGFAPIGWKDAVVPFVSAYRPLWLGLGAIAFDLVVALVVTSLLRHRIGHRAGACSTGSRTCAGPLPCSTGWAPGPTRSSASCWARTWCVSSRSSCRSGGGSQSTGRPVPAPASLLSGSASWRRSSWPYGWSPAPLPRGGHAPRGHRSAC